MSWQHMLLARDLPARSSVKLTAMVLASHANVRGRAWPAIETLETETGLGRSTVFRALRVLREAGVITVHRRGGGCEYRFKPIPHQSHRWTHPSHSGTENDAQKSHSGTHKRGKVIEKEPAPVTPVDLPHWMRERLNRMKGAG